MAKCNALIDTLTEWSKYAVLVSLLTAWALVIVQFMLGA